MTAFASRTGILQPEKSGARYLWTDAFALFSFLAIYELTGKDVYRDWALRLVDQVHQVLGRHRDDDPRRGWISGLNESAGARHPTCGGLRIGKRLNERGPDEPYDEQFEWDRDGQYFHYLTKWMHALDRVTLMTGDQLYNDWALELAEAAHRAFVHESPDGGRRIYWKMSIDLSRPLVPSMGQLDALDGFVTYNRLDATRIGGRPSHGPDLGRIQSDLCHMCESRTWTTGDELGLGGLLAEAGQLIQLIADGALDQMTIVDDVLRDVQHNLRVFAAHHNLDRPAELRLAFRELGLSIGLQAVRPMRDNVVHYPDRFCQREALLTRIDAISRYVPMIEQIEEFWLDPDNQRAITWTNHRDINSVMLATNLVPHVYLTGSPDLSVGCNSVQPTRTEAGERHK